LAPEAIYFELPSVSEIFHCCIVVGLDLCRRNISHRLEQVLVIETIDPFECGVFDGLK
jgi:hypothetical protein